MENRALPGVHRHEEGGTSGTAFLAEGLLLSVASPLTASTAKRTSREQVLRGAHHAPDEQMALNGPNAFAANRK